MKIGILTFHNTTNYGAVLHTYALYKLVKQLGHDVEIINYTNPSIRDKELPFFTIKYGGIKTFLRSVSLQPVLIKKYILLKRFLDSRVSISHKIKHRDKYKLKERYDKVFVGSDIVWELNLTDGDFTYFLDFVTDSNKKFAFSSSFGYDFVPPKFFLKAKNYLAAFSMIAVRESQGQRILYNMLHRDIPVVLDPTLLLDRKQWLSDVKLTEYNFKYILIYFPDEPGNAFKLANQLAQRNNYKIVLLSDAVFTKTHVTLLHGVGVKEFLGLINCAQYVITTSYHGLLFSINFQKQFFYSNCSHSSRISSIVEKLNIADREISYVFSHGFIKIDYKKINKIIENERSESMIILKQMLER